MTKKIKRARVKIDKTRSKVKYEQERDLLIKYGLRNKNELGRMDYLVNKYKKTLRFYPEESSIVIEVKQKLHRLDIIPYNEEIEVYKITRNAFLERRLQTLVSRKNNLSMASARQLITHGHVLVNHKKITAPSFLVRLQNQPKIQVSIPKK